MSATVLPDGADEVREIFGSFIDETIRIVAEHGPGLISFAVGSPATTYLPSGV